MTENDNLQPLTDWEMNRLAGLVRILQGAVPDWDPALFRGSLDGEPVAVLCVYQTDEENQSIDVAAMAILVNDNLCDRLQLADTEEPITKSTRRITIPGLGATEPANSATVDHATKMLNELLDVWLDDDIEPDD